jgi:hypothetical protein
MGVRLTRLLRGVKKLTLQEMKTGRRFQDVIGYSGAYANAPEFQIPYGCLVPAKLDNLLAAGRCVSSDFQVADTLRLIPVCWVTGQAAGLAAALCVRNGCRPREVNDRQVAERAAPAGIFRMRSRKRLLRLLVRLASFSIFCVLVAGLPWVLQQIGIQASPFVAVGSSLALWDFSVGSIIGFAFAVVAMASRRWFCRYVCPVGFLLEGAGLIGLKKHSWWSSIPAIGRCVALATFIGALIGYPLFCGWIRWRFSSSAFPSCCSEMRDGDPSGFLLAILILFSLTSGDFWWRACVRRAGSRNGWHR